MNGSLYVKYRRSAEVMVSLLGMGAPFLCREDTAWR